MEIEKAAVAGTLESSDCMVTVEDGDGNIDLVLESTVIHQYGNQIRHVVLDTLESLGVQNVKIKIVDKGAPTARRNGIPQLPPLHGWCSPELLYLQS